VARIAFIIDDLFEDVEYLDPYERVQEAGHDAVTVGQAAGKEVSGKKGAMVTTDAGTSDIEPSEFDALVIPGGYSPDKVRTDPKAVEFTRRMHEAGKPVAAICHAPWVLAEADLVRGRTITSYHSLRTDMINAGATWVDEKVVEDGNLITSRHPGDIPAFCDALLSRLT
jgi:protease I